MSSRILPEFELLTPTSVPEVLVALGKLRDKATIMAGGTDVLVALKDSFRTDYVVSLAKVPDLDYVSFDDAEGLRIGARANLTTICDEPVIKAKYQALWESAQVNGSAQTREMATLMGNIMRGSPAGDCSCAVLALGGSVVFKGPSGDREVSIDEMWPAYGQTARKPDELAIEVRLPALGEGVGSSFRRLTRTYDDLSKLNAAVRLDMEGGTCKDARIAMGCVGPTLIRLPKCEAVVKGAGITDEVLDEVARIVPGEIKPIDDVRSTAEYRQAVAGPIVTRLIRKILGKGEQ